MKLSGNRLFQTVATALMLAVTVVADPVQLDFTVSRPPKDYYVKRNTAEMPIEHEGIFYMVDVQMGSNNNSNILLIDTGSSDMWVIPSDVVCICRECYLYYFTKRDVAFFPGQDSKTLHKKEDLEKDRIIGHGPLYGLAHLENNDPQPTPAAKVKRATSSSTTSWSTTRTCTLFGSFNTADSESFRENTTAPDFEIAYADGTEAWGIWGRDTISFGGVTVHDLSFGIGQYSTSDVGVFGIGLMALEATSYQYLNLPAKMKAEGIIKKNAYSIYLNTIEGKTGSVLFGGIDRSKYEGDLVTFPMVNTYGYGRQARLTMAISGMSVTVGDEEVSVMDNTYGVLLDTGATYSYVSRSVLQNVARSLGATYDSSLQAYFLDCPSEDAGFVTFDFNGFKIEVPLSEMTTAYDTSTCFLTLFSKSDSNYFTLGDNFLRSAYVVFDLDDLEISLAKVKHDDQVDIVEIESTIPGATTNAGYSSTQIASYFSSEASETASLNYNTTAGSPTSSRGSRSTSTSSRSTSTSSRGVAGNAATPIGVTSLLSLLVALLLALV